MGSSWKIVLNTKGACCCRNQKIEQKKEAVAVGQYGFKKKLHKTLVEGDIRAVGSGGRKVGSDSDWGSLVSYNSLRVWL